MKKDYYLAYFVLGLIFLVPPRKTSKLEFFLEDKSSTLLQEL